MSDTFVVVDGNSLMHRAFHALPPLSNEDGVFTNAVFGFLSMLLKVVGDERRAISLWHSICTDRPSAIRITANTRQAENRPRPS